MGDLAEGVCRRLAMLRQQKYGSRGRAEFSRALGIGPSTYTHYERDRLPPADVLLRAAQLTRTRLEWLISGEGEPSESPNGPLVDEADELSERLRTLMHAYPHVIPQVEAFLTILTQVQPTLAPNRPEPRRPAPQDRSHLIPIVGSTSAGTARYWHESPGSVDGPIADARLESLIAECTDDAVATTAGRFSQAAAEGPVSLVQFSHPDDRGVIEFLSAPQFRAQHADCIAWRIDGDSMAPRYLDGDFVLTSPRHRAENGYSCVVRQQGQVGVNCKLFREEGDSIWLIPVNSKYPNQIIPRKEVVWAWRVIASVRLGPPPA